MMKLPRYAVTAALGFVLSLGPSSVVAQEKTDKAAPSQKADEATVSADVIVLHATNNGIGIDPKIGQMPELGKPPFSSYNSYTLLDRGKHSLARGKSVTLKLPNDRVLKVELKDVVAPKKKDESKKYVVSASIQKPDGKSFLPLLEVNAKAGETFFVAGQTHKGGVLVIGIKVVP